MAKKEKDPRHRVKIVTLTSLGEAVAPGLRRRLGWQHLKDIVRDLQLHRSPAEEVDLLMDLVVEVFDTAYDAFYEAGQTGDLEWFRGGFEERLRERLDEKIGDRMGVVHDVDLIVNEILREELLEDAMLAKEKGHFLTQNHRYVLRRIAHMKESELTEHNVRWKDSIMTIAPNGSESWQEFMNRVNPVKIVEREMNERGVRQPEIIKPLGDRYDANEKWNPAIGMLVKRWNEADKGIRRRKAP
jgi:hypothetical protein